MRKSLLAMGGTLCIIAGIGVLAIQIFQDPEEQVYVYPPGAAVGAYHETIPSSESQLHVDGCPVPHQTVSVEVSEAAAKKLREEAGYSSEGVSGGVLVTFKETGPCSVEKVQAGT